MGGGANSVPSRWGGGPGNDETPCEGRALGDIYFGQDKHVSQRIDDICVANPHSNHNSNWAQQIVVRLHSLPTHPRRFGVFFALNTIPITQCPQATTIPRCGFVVSFICPAVPPVLAAAGGHAAGGRRRPTAGAAPPAPPLPHPHPL